MTDKKIIPKFKSEKEEFEFWQNCNLSDYFCKDDFIKLENSKFFKSFNKLVSIRLSLYMINVLKKIAQEKGIGYQKLIKLYIKQGINNDRQEN